MPAAKVRDFSFLITALRRTAARRSFFVPIMLQCMSLLLADTVAKVGGPLQVSNYRIKRARRLNQSCATHRFLEPILRVGMRKFFLQQYRHIADIRGAATFCPLLDKSGQRYILARDGLSAYDPLCDSLALR